MNKRNGLKIRHYVALAYSILGILGAVYSFATRGFSIVSRDDIAVKVFYPIAYLLLLGAVVAYSRKKERLSKILAAVGLGIIIVFVTAGIVLSFVAGGGVPIPLYIYSFAVLIVMVLLFYLFLKND